MTEAIKVYFASEGTTLDSELPQRKTMKIFHFNDALKNIYFLFQVNTTECGKINTNMKNTKENKDNISIKLL